MLYYFGAVASVLLFVIFTGLYVLYTQEQRAIRARARRIIAETIRDERRARGW
jgi:hypothetical protein